jgi:hypothetical protein
MSGTYFESCSCDALCPCTWSGLSVRATTDRCNSLLVFHVDAGDVEGVTIDDLTFALVIDSPALMGEGNWRVGLLIDDRASDEQVQKLEAVIAGQLGGWPALLGALIADRLGTELAPISFEDDGRVRRVRIGTAIDVEVEDFIPVGSPTGEPVQVTNVLHPASSTLTAAPAKRARVSAFGIEFGRTGESGFSASFSWTS